MRKVSVIGIGETRFGKLPNMSLKDMIKEAGEKAIADAGIEKEMIQSVYFGNFNAQYLCYQGHLGPMVSEVLGLGNIPTVRTEGACASGSLALRQAYVAVASGLYDVVLVGGVEKMTHQPTNYVTTGIASASDFEAEGNIGITFPSIFAMIANRYFYEYSKDAREAMAVCAVQNHDNALLNPDAQLRKKITVEDVYNGFMITDPLTVFDCSLVTDGSVFAVVCSEEIARKYGNGRAVDIIGSGHAGDALSLAGKKTITTFAATRGAAAEAYKMAGLTPKDIDFAEVHDCFTITQIINGEDLGFFEHGKGWKAVLEGRTARDGEKPINVSGGLKAKGHPIGATGISQLYEVVTQLRGEAGERQLKKADIGLTHNIGGSGATCVVNIFRRSN